MDKNDFDRDAVRYDACLYRIIVVAEAANGLPEEVTQRATEVPWRNLIGMGHNLKHQYFRVEADIVWDTIAQHIPTLLGAVNRLLAEEQNVLENS